MGGDHHGHGDPYKIPDYRIFKVENAPELMVTQKVLAAQGLKDPWLRNEVWRYSVKDFGTEGSRTRLLFLRGFRVGFAGFLVTIAGQAVYDRLYPSEHGHDHHDH